MGILGFVLVILLLFVVVVIQLTKIFRNKFWLLLNFFFFTNILVWKLFIIAEGFCRVNSATNVLRIFRYFQVGLRKAWTYGMILCKTNDVFTSVYFLLSANIPLIKMYYSISSPFENKKPSDLILRDLWFSNLADSVTVQYRMVVRTFALFYFLYPI